MKKLISVILALVMALTAAAVASAAFDKDAKELSFNADGKFTILQFNDTQDVGKNADERMISFVKAAVTEVNPDLVVFVGDQLSDLYPLPSKEDYAIALDNILGVCEDAGVPFAATLGNHDHDRCSTVPEDEMYELYAAYSTCLNHKGYDYFTFNLPVRSSDGSRTALNVYMMDSNNTDGLNGNSSGYDGVTKDAVEWYCAKSDELKAANGGEVVPSVLFQHVPVKEIYNLLKVCKWTDEGAIYSRRDGYWYVMDETKCNGGKLGEAPCSEDFDTITGQYQAWLEKGDIIGAWFAHDHVNTFDGVTDDGIRLGYNGGSGFRSYGNTDERSARVFEFDEDDAAGYETYLMTYGDLIGDTGFVISDIATPAWLNRIMKVVYALFGWLIELFK